MTERLETPLSIELYSAGKVIARECAEVNLDYLRCMKKNRNDTFDCLEGAGKTLSCATRV
jgi:hypothetical protein